MKKFLYIISTTFIFVLFAVFAASCGKMDINSLNNTDPTTNTEPVTSTEPITSIEPATTNTTENTNPFIKPKEKYTITFVNDDDSLLISLSVEDGKIPSYPLEDPTKESDNTYTYEFAGWDKKLVAAKENTTYKATYSKEYINYTVKFVNYNDEVINSETYHYGDEVVAPNSPERMADNTCYYEFIGWDKSVVSCNGDAVYKAVYSGIYINYKIKFIDYNDELVEETNYHYGDDIVLPENPTRDHYRFIGWSLEKNGSLADVSKVRGDKTYYAVYEESKYTYTFYNEDGTILKQATINYGEEIVKPENPTKAATKQYTYTFDGWYTSQTGGAKVSSFGTISGNENFYARFNSVVNQYTYTFYNGSTICKKATVDYGTSIIKPNNPTMASTSEYEYTFDGWYTSTTGGTKVTSFGTITDNVNYYARFTQKKVSYTIKFYYSSGGNLYTTITQEWGTKVTAPTNPTMSGYTFNGWNQTIPTTMPKSNTTIIATWTASSYKLTVTNNAGSKVVYKGITSGTYTVGTSITLSISSKAPTYQINWDVNGTIYTGDSVTFKMPGQATTVKITSKPFTVISSTQLQMGTYPQTKVTASSELDAIWASSKIHISNNKALDTNYWYNVGDVTLNGDAFNLWYIDIDLDDDGYYDYRGVYFTPYRPYNLNAGLGAENSYQDNGGYTSGMYYWFKYEPITWNISLNDSGKQYLYSDKILDGYYFYPSTNTSQFSHNGGTAYATTYRYSNLYAYMCNTMLYFLTSDQISLLTGVSSSGTTAKIAVVENNTIQSSYVMASTTQRKAKVTDYARCMGVYANSSGYGDYWTSSQTSNGASTIIVVNEDGTNSAEQAYKFCGIRPFIALDTTKVTL